MTDAAFLRERGPDVLAALAIALAEDIAETMEHAGRTLDNCRVRLESSVADPATPLRFVRFALTVELDDGLSDGEAAP